ncbi:MAG: ribonuclease HIII [Desulfurobacteriaceae bacterium]
MLNREEIEELVKRLTEKGASLEKPPEHAIYRLKKDKGILTIYKTGSLVFGGKEARVLKEEVETFYLEKLEKVPKIGCDEAGKGEFIGPLVVACIFADENCLKELVKLGVKDSKKLKKEKILELSKNIKKDCRGRVRVLMPKAYNELYEKFKNVNRLLEAVYMEVLEELIKKYSPKKVVVDKFSNEIEEKLKRKFSGIDFEVIPKAEKDIVVAAASIVAKAERLKAMDILSKKLGIKLPEGNINNEKVFKLIPPRKRKYFLKLHFLVRGEK